MNLRSEVQKKNVSNFFLPSEEVKTCLHGVPARSYLDKIHWPSRQGSELKVAYYSFSET